MTHKEECKKKIIKDLKPFIIATVITAVIIIAFMIISPEAKAILAEGGAFNGTVAAIILATFVPILFGFEIAGFIMGWKWLSQRIKAQNLLGLCIKVANAPFIGYIMFPVILVKDIIAYNKA